MVATRVSWHVVDRLARGNADLQSIDLQHGLYSIDQKSARYRQNTAVVCDDGQRHRGIAVA